MPSDPTGLTYFRAPGGELIEMLTNLGLPNQTENQVRDNTYVRDRRTGFENIPLYRWLYALRTTTPEGAYNPGLGR